MSENFPKPKQKPKTTAENPKGDVSPDSKSIDEKVRDEKENGKEGAAAPTSKGSQASDDQNSNKDSQTQGELSPKPEPSEIGERKAKPELKGDYGQSLSNPEENSDPTKSESRDVPSLAYKRLDDLRKKSAEALSNPEENSNPTKSESRDVPSLAYKRLDDLRKKSAKALAETSKPVEPQESVDQSRP